MLFLVCTEYQMTAKSIEKVVHFKKEANGDIILLSKSTGNAKTLQRYVNS